VHSIPVAVDADLLISVIGLFREGKATPRYERFNGAISP
jgi:hypothetical protein